MKNYAGISGSLEYHEAAHIMIIVCMCSQSIDPDRSYDHDVYDELLTQAEIQGNINKVNSQYLPSTSSFTYTSALLFDRLAPACWPGARVSALGLFVGWLLNIPATCKCISGTDLLR